MAGCPIFPPALIGSTVAASSSTPPRRPRPTPPCHRPERAAPCRTDGGHDSGLFILQPLLRSTPLCPLPPRWPLLVLHAASPSSSFTAATSSSYAATTASSCAASSSSPG
ncbi:hypothetical protein GQ55_2G113500 [Panicum hallii var. hallii]|uniref:Uncharacterized protein n=1 Tax=Panicum hallii var. hallii TaxID=1504633 RepID=A0A2T7ENU5_9POAL|nr:hypothetical protein GQ55_2G113500 [Panicum hallii var. hallii]